MDIQHLSPAKQWIFRNAEVLVERFFSKKPFFIIAKAHYEDSWKQELMRELLNLKEVENIIPCEEGLKVFLY